MKKFLKRMFWVGLITCAAMAVSDNPCNYEVNVVMRTERDLWYAVDQNMGEPAISQLERRLAGALFSLDLCLVEHLLY